MRKSVSPVRVSETMAEADLIEKRKQLKASIAKLTENIKTQETQNNSIAKNLKKNEIELQKLLNVSKDKNKAFLTRLQKAVKQQKNSKATFDLSDSFIAKNSDTIKKTLADKGFMSEKDITLGSKKSSTHNLSTTSHIDSQSIKSASVKSKKQQQGNNNKSKLTNFIVKKTNQYPLKALSSYHRTLYYAEQMSHIKKPQ